MERKSLVLLGIFLLPFAAVGIWVEGMAVNAFLKGEIGQGFVLLGFGLAFLGFPGMIGGMTWWGWKKKKDVEREKEIAPTEPWRWNPEWREGKIRSGGNPAFLGISAFALVWCSISFPMVILLWDDLVSGENGGAYVALLFPVIGIGILSYVLYLGWRRYVYGVPVFHLERNPGVLGGTLQGRILLQVPLAPEGGVSVRLFCVRETTTGSGKNRSTSEEILWQSEQPAVHPATAGDASGTVIPVRFAVPVDLPASSPERGNPSIVWRLEASAEVPGVDFAATFGVPVFQTGSSSLDQTESALRTESLRHAGSHHTPPAEGGIVVRRSGAGGTEYLLRPGRNAGAGIGGGLTALVFMGMVAGLVLGGAPAIFPVVVAIFGLIILFAVVQMTVGETAFVIEEKTLAIRHSIFGIMSGKRIPCADVEKVTVREGGRSGTTRFFAIAVVRKGGTEVRGMGLIRVRQHADWLASEIERSCKEA